MKMFLIAMIILAIVLASIAWVKISTRMGVVPSKSQMATYSQSANLADGKFKAQAPVTTTDSNWLMLKEGLLPQANRRPGAVLPARRSKPTDLSGGSDSEAKLFWLGHSRFLIRMAGKIFLIDPMFGQYASPVPFPHLRRYEQEETIKLDDLPPIDAVLYSHGHYDHLDYDSVMAIKGKVGMFYVPFGIGSTLESWGVEKRKIQELGWWDETTLGDIELTLGPAQHFSGRGIFDHGRTLWASWIIRAGNHSIFFSGDSGYGPHFAEVGARYGPFSIALMESAQYDKNWKYMHMFPEEAVQAGLDLGAEVVLPMHWAGFSLANHPWTEPVERAITAADALGARITTPQIGQPIVLGEGPLPESRWWRTLSSEL